ncbi:hypothetical protein [Sphingobium xenophagum]|uniref:hypothetical protein n=1 Tax=Sphingobium xenophagum TaxID=121428 RepID=UPI001C0B5898|nr:hypothetical protein [Sphingobium xenophagum]QWT14564.1 hypothetical protein GTV57_01940 [Sphingobium xenophagum]
MLKIDLFDLLNKTPAIKKMVEQKVVDVAAKVTLDVHANVVAGSPVDTGEFRGKWTVETPTQPFQNGKVENTTPYGPQLVNGHSDQAPKGWIDNAVLAATRL